MRLWVERMFPCSLLWTSDHQRGLKVEPLFWALAFNCKLLSAWGRFDKGSPQGRLAVWILDSGFGAQLVCCCCCCVVFSAPMPWGMTVPGDGIFTRGNPFKMVA